MNKVENIENIPTYISSPKDQPKGGIIVIHEVWGLNDHTKDIADRFAREGYLAIAPDLLADTGIDKEVMGKLQVDLFDPSKRNEVQPILRELMSPIQTPEFGKETTQKLVKLFNYLYNRPEVNKLVGVIGYCFGGTYSYNLAIAEPKLSFAIPYYGHCDSDIQELTKIQAPIQAFFGEKDEALIQKLPDLENRMSQAKVDFSYQVYSDCGHAFFNDTNKFAFNKEAAEDSWIKTLDFISKHLA